MRKKSDKDYKKINNNKNKNKNNKNKNNKKYRKKVTK